jgi:two-component system response regulator NreC
MGTVIRCVLADDHILVRDAISASLDRETDFECLKVFGDAREAAEYAVTEGAHVLILDVAMPGLSPFDAARMAMKARPELKVIFLSGHDDDDFVLHAIEAGAHAYVLKSGPADELKIAIRKAYRGEKHLPLAERFFEQGEMVLRRDGLTAREREVLKLLAEGNTVRDIALGLDLSVKTIETHKTNMMRKLGLHNKAQLVQYAVAQKLIVVDMAPKPDSGPRIA